MRKKRAGKAASGEAETRTEQIADLIADGIMSGEFGPETRLDEQSLAARFKVSRTPVREALRQLAATNMVELRPRRGAFVRSISQEELEVLFVAMAEIEATCARLAAMSMGPLERQRLQALHRKMERMAGDGDMDDYSDANVQFHEAIYTGAHNAVLAEIARNLRSRLAFFRRFQFRSDGRLRNSIKEHAAIVEAIVRGDSNAAREAMLIHVGLVEEAFESVSQIVR